jgi:manganese transport protein
LEKSERVEGDERPVSLEEVHRTVSIPEAPSFLRRFFAFAGPAYLVSVGYMDPGNWATDLEGGARFNYTLIWVLLMSNAMALLLQTLSARMGVVAGRDLAQACREKYPRPVRYVLWVTCEIAIAACDLAEVLGSAVAINLLFHIPLLWGVIITAGDVVVLLSLQRAGVRRLEAIILSLVSVIGLCMVVQIVLAKPDWAGVVTGFVPRLDSRSLYVAIGILGATVMPHNLYLHSALVQTRAVEASAEAKRVACRFNLLDSAIALNGAFLVNSALLVMAAATFYRHGVVVTEIQQAYRLLEPLLGTLIAPIAFAVALLASGQSSTITGTLAGQIVMEGFVRVRMKPWLRRLVTRLLAIIPAVVTILVYGEQGTYGLLIMSQVLLSLQLPFAVVPLIHFTSDQERMGEFASPWWVRVLAWGTAGIIISLNSKLLADTLAGWLRTAGEGKWMIYGIVIPIVVALAGLLLWLTFGPAVRKLREAVATRAIPPSELPRPAAYRRIGVALERSAADEDILSHALGAAKPHRAGLVLLHVVESAAGRWHGQEARDLETEDDDKYLERLVSQLRGAGYEAEPDLRFGDAADQLIQAAGERNLDLLVMGGHGHRVIGDVVYGQTVAKVRHAISIPVLVVRIGVSRGQPPVP